MSFDPVQESVAAHGINICVEPRSEPVPVTTGGNDEVRRVGCAGNIDVLECAVELSLRTQDAPDPAIDAEVRVIEGVGA